MTAQVAVMNKKAIALASDSAKFRTRGVAEKIFALPVNHPIGIMIYGQPEIYGIHWETIIDKYAKTLTRKKQLNTMADYVVDFVKYVESDQQLFSGIEQRNYFKKIVELRLYNIAFRLSSRMKQEQQMFSDQKLQDILSRIIEKKVKRIKRQPNLPDFPDCYPMDLAKKYQRILKNAIRKYIPTSLLSDSVEGKLKELCVGQFNKGIFLVVGWTGFVFAGYGSGDKKPVIIELKVGKVLNGRLRYAVIRELTISKKASSSITPFANENEVRTFVRGIHAKYIDHLEKTTKRYCEPSKNINLYKNLIEFETKEFLSPIISTIASMSIKELADVAETFINLVIFRQKISGVEKTVGGPVDVAVITKDKGFEWVKRKRTRKPVRH